MLAYKLPSWFFSIYFIVYLSKPLENIIYLLLEKKKLLDIFFLLDFLLQILRIINIIFNIISFIDIKER